MIGKMFLAAIVSSIISISAYAEQQRNIELLASSCAACHGTNGHSVGGTPSLAGLGQLHFIEQMTEFTDGSRKATVMLHHASGYTDTEIEQLAEFFAKQRP